MRDSKTLPVIYSASSPASCPHISPNALETKKRGIPTQYIEASLKDHIKKHYLQHVPLENHPY